MMRCCIGMRPRSLELMRREGRSASLARGRDLTISHAALDRTEAILQQAMKKHGLAKETLDELQLLLMNIHGTHRNIQVLEIELVALMEGRAVCQPGDETFARCIRLLVGSPWIDFIEPDPAYLLYMWLTYGDPYQERTILHLDWNIDFLRKYFYPQVEAAYIQWNREVR
jgi:hypothetical protein